MTKEITYTSAYAQFDPSKVGESEFILSGFADELIRKGYATDKKPSKVNNDGIGIKPIRLFNKNIKGLVKRGYNRNKITAYMATFPSREDVLEKAILSLYKQVDELVVLTNGDMVVPKYPNVSTYNLFDKIGDVGCAGKFVFASEWKGYVLTVDDDFIYPDDYVAETIKAIDKYQKKAVISWHGRTLFEHSERYKNGHKDFYQCCYDVDGDYAVNIIGTGVCGFHADVFLGNPYDVIEMTYTNSSDIWFSLSCDQRGIPMIVPKHKKGWLIQLETGRNCISYGTKYDEMLTGIINSRNWVLQDKIVKK